MAQQKQIAKAAQSTRADVGFPARAHFATMTFVPVSPPGRGQRATAVGEASQHEQNTAAADTADDGERAALKWMALARDDEPLELGGSNRFANPQEYLISALNACA